MALLVVFLVGLLNLGIVAPAPGADRYQASIPSARFGPIIPSVTTRFLKLDDARRNWGILYNRTMSDEEDNTDYNRPITIPRPSDSSKIQPKESVEAKPPGNLLSGVNEPTKPKRFIDRLTDVNIGQKTTNVVAAVSPYSCDIVRMKCCINNLSLDKCPNARDCIKSEDASNMCDAVVLRESLKRILSML